MSGRVHLCPAIKTASCLKAEMQSICVFYVVSAYSDGIGLPSRKEFVEIIDLI